MSKVLIKSNPDFIKPGEGNLYLNISELFSETIQGEGISVGIPATFLRLKDCTLSCSFCDTYSVWRYGNKYSFEEIVRLFQENGIIDRFREGEHLIFTGGSPLLQQSNLILFIKYFVSLYGFKPYIEVENECCIEPEEELIALVDQWNNSPKLSNSNMSEELRYHPEILKKLSQLDNSWFKFVVTEDSSWKEIQKDFLKKNLIRKDQVILMPEGEDQEGLSKTRQLTVDIACRECVKYSDRLHIVIWNKKTGV